MDARSLSAFCYVADELGCWCVHLDHFSVAEQCGEFVVQFLTGTTAAAVYGTAGCGDEVVVGCGDARGDGESWCPYGRCSAGDAAEGVSEGV